MLSVSQPNVVLSALKPGGDGSLVVRVFEAEGKATNGASIHLASKVKRAESVNALEKPVEGDVRIEKDAVTFDLHPFEIRTFRVFVESAGR
jgi:alpha-mannosidase